MLQQTNEVIEWRGPGWYGSAQEHDSDRQEYIHTYHVSDAYHWQGHKAYYAAWQMGLGTPIYLAEPPSKEGVTVHDHSEVNND